MSGWEAYMKRIYDREAVEACLQQTGYAAQLRELREQLFVTQYEKGEFVTSPLKKEQYIQIIVQGSLRIYYVRDDGSVYSLAHEQTNDLLGEMELFRCQSGSVYAEASDTLTCLALSIAENRDRLLASCLFLQLICESLTRKLEAITRLDAAPATLKQRVLTYMRYKCAGGELKGLKQAAFHLHCSARQLQRILNQYEAERRVVKCGKGAYRLLERDGGEG